MTEYPAKVVNKARELYLTPVEGAPKPWRSYEVVARLLNAEFGTSLPKKTINEWAKKYGWIRPDLDGGTMPPSDLPALPGNSVGGDRLNRVSVAPAQGGQAIVPADWSWEERKGTFLANLAGIASTCLAVDPNGNLIFKDDESRIKTGIATLEMIGKIESGKFDKAEKGDMIPALKPGQMEAVLMFFTNPNAPTPNLGPVIDTTASDGDSDDSN